MKPTLWQQFMEWLCLEFDHKPVIEGLTENEICRRCGKLLSTPYSRGYKRP